MDDTVTPDHKDEQEAPRSRWQRPSLSGFSRNVLRTGGFLLLAACAAIAAFLIFLDTAPGHRFVANQIRGMPFENGLRIDIGRIDGSLYRDMVLRDVSVQDPEGEFLHAPEVRVDWRPLRFVLGVLDIQSAEAGLLTLRRLPRFREVPPDDAPLLPDFDIVVGRVTVDRLVAEAPVAGERQTASLSGRALSASGRARLWLDVRTIEGGGNSGGDTLSLVIDAVPEDNRLALSADIAAPEGGVIAAIAGLDRALALRLAGKGDWQRWDGSLIADYGENELARLQIAARDGAFSVQGPLRAGGLAQGQLAALLGDVTTLDLAARVDGSAAQLDGTLRSDAFELAAQGGVDVSAGQFDDLRLSFDLLRPSVLAANLRGDGVAVRLTLNGAFAMPRVAYALTARRIVMDGMGVEGFSAQGNARIDADRMVIPVAARARRITGLDTVAGGTLENVRLDGDLAISGSRVLSDNMRIRSSRIDATAILLADLDAGRYTGAIDGRIDSYRLESVGIFTVETDADLERTADGFALTGRVRARSTRLLNDSLREYLGGNFVAASNVRYETDGTVRLSQLRFEAPDLRITGGSGRYSPDGRIALDANASSRRYGPIAVRMAGTIADPQATIRAERPGLGIGLANLNARVTGARGGYRLDLTANTDYGPLAADVMLGTGRVITLDITSADLSGIGFTGALRQTATGPFAGSLRAQGNGLSGVLQLDAQNGYQEVVFNLRSTGTRLEGPAGFRIGSAIVDGRAVLFDTPWIVADAQVRGARIGTDLYLNAARVKLDYRDGAGTAQAVVEGRSLAPFRLAANAEMQPDLWRIMLDGRVRGISVKSQGPARIVPGKSGYELLPSAFAVGDGTVRLAGRYGPGVQIRSQLEGVDVAMANAFVPGLGVGGKASGTIQFAQASPAAFPVAEARLTLAGFTQTSAATSSPPVDINLVGKLVDEGGELNAVMRQRGSVIGRLQAGLKPIGGGPGPWSERLIAAPLSGGLRYNGPAATLFSLSGMANQSLSGSLGIAADFSCTLGSPCLGGVARGKDLAYVNQLYGTRLTGLSFTGRFAGDRLNIAELRADAGNGRIDGTGYIGLAADEGYPMDLALSLNQAQLARSNALSASATGDLRLTKSAGETALLSGRLRLPETRYRIVRQGVAQIPQLTGVRFKPRRGRERITGDEVAEPITSVFSTVRLDIELRAPERLYVSGMGLESEWSADLTVTGTSEAPRMAGSVDLVRGTLGFAGRSFELTQGRIGFTGGEIDPTLRIAARETVEDVAVTVNIDGRASNPQVAFASVPSLPQDEIVSRILFGSSIANLSPLQAVQLAASLNSLRASGGGLNPLGKLRSATGVDRLRILGEDEEAGRGTALAAGKYLTDDIYVELITDTRGFTATQLEVAITPWLSLLSQAGGSGGSNVNIRIRKDY